MIFNSSDVPIRSSYESAPLGIPPDEMPGEISESRVPNDLGLSIKDIGMSVPMGISAGNVPGVAAKIRSGAGHLEIQFPGSFSGQRNAQTPEMYGKDARQALRELAEANEVKLTTHAAFGVMGMMGQNQQGQFSLTRAQMAAHEVERAIDFAADTAGGGAVVLHSGEFERPLTDMVLDDHTGRQNLSRDQEGRLLFKQKKTEVWDAVWQMLDDRTSQMMETVEKDRLVAQPVWKVATKDYWGVDNTDTDEKNAKKVLIKKGDYVDYEGRKILDPYDPKSGRVPEYDRDTGRFKTRLYHFDDFRKESEEYNKWLEQKYLRDKGRKPGFYEKVYPEEMFIRATLHTQAGHSRGWALQYGEHVDQHLKNIDKIKKALEFYNQIKEKVPESEHWKLMKQSGYDITGGLTPPDTKAPWDALQEALNRERKSLEFARQASASQEQQAEDTEETARHLVTPIKRLEREGIRHYAELGIHAFRRSKDPNNPVFVAIENLFPEKFGSHPQELKWIVQKTRQRFVDILTSQYMDLGDSKRQLHRRPEDTDESFDKKMWGENKFFVPGITKDEAQKLAERHIAATFDTGHVNLWRKYWQDNPRLSPDQNDEAFRQWLITQVQDLAEHKIIGHMHLSDNYGYHDDHLAPGQGTSPVKEIVEKLRKFDFKGNYTVEPGADATTDNSDFHGLMKTWRHFGTPVYGYGGGSIGVGAPARTWTDVQHSYFGMTAPPYFVFGSYSPSQDWSLWSQVPME
ncbi:sugar phosphate isomerase/epimerase [Candidatus Woesearchaeota archaeon]|nr:sugar phosphate isomerase/epimerase [Candidatus Woesearchaeota archaeon]